MCNSFIEFMLAGFLCWANTSDINNLEEGKELLLIVVSELLLCDLLTLLLWGLSQSRRSWQEHMKEQKLLAFPLLESNKRMIRIWDPNVPIKNRFPTTQFLSQEPTFLLRFSLHPVIPHTKWSSLQYLGIWEIQPIEWPYSLHIVFSLALSKGPLITSTHSVHKKCKVALSICCKTDLDIWLYWINNLHMTE